MNAWHLLQVLKDVRDEGRASDEPAILEQLELDAEHLRVSMPRFTAKAFKPYRYTADYDDYDDIEEEESIEDFRVRVGVQARVIEARDWTAWRKPASTVNLTTLQEIYKRRYNDAAIDELVNRQPPNHACPVVTHRCHR